MSRYDLFLFDLDDTLLDFKASEKLAFTSLLNSLGLAARADTLFADYQQINRALWLEFEEGKTTKEHLKTERFRRLFAKHGVEEDPLQTGIRYLDGLPKNVVLVDGAVELCRDISSKYELGIITNGIHSVQTQRIANSQLAPYISFVCVSEECGFAKPDVRFFEHSSRMAKKFAKASSLVIGDRLETDIQGAFNFGVDSCWFNPLKEARSAAFSPTYEIAHLSELTDRLAKS